MTRQAKRTPNATQNNPPLFRFLLGCLTALTIYAFWGWSMGGWTVALGMVIFFGFAAPLFFFFWSAKLVLGLSKIKKINLKANLELSESILRAFYKKPELFDDIEVMKFESPQSFFYFQESLFSSKVRLYLSSGFLDTKVSDLELSLIHI